MKAAAACIALTPGGRAMALRLGERLPADVYLPLKLMVPGSKSFEGPLKDFFPELFAAYQSLVCIMATGIVVRMLAPLLQGKDRDPAVVVADEGGRFAISFLSGHLGGANSLARKVAAILGGTPVITTATDTVGREGADLLALRLGLGLDPLPNLKGFNAMLAAGDVVPLYGDFPPELAGEGYRVEALDAWQGAPAVLVTEKVLQGTACLFLRPKILVAGVGFRRWIPGVIIRAAVKEALRRGGFAPGSLRTLATVDLKRDDPGGQDAADMLGVPIQYFAREEIMALEGEFPGSPWVKEQIGVSGVCEPTALLAAKNGRMVAGKLIVGKVTVALARDESAWWESAPAVLST